MTINIIHSKKSHSKQSPAKYVVDGTELFENKLCSYNTSKLQISKMSQKQKVYSITK